MPTVPIEVEAYKRLFKMSGVLMSDDPIFDDLPVPDVVCDNCGHANDIPAYETNICSRCGKRIS